MLSEYEAGASDNPLTETHVHRKVRMHMQGYRGHDTVTREGTACTC
jgi:hypothetical protein